MNGRLIDALNCRKPDRVPFVPAIYEHKAWFVGQTPSRVCRDAELFTDAVLAEYEQIRSDALAIGIDVYNVEAEAVGSKVTYFDGDDISIPAVGSDAAVLKEDHPVDSLKIPDPLRDGRMPLNLEVARRVVKELGQTVPIRGAISGPFSLAANLVGAENLFMMTLSSPERVHKLLSFSARVAREFGRAFIETGCGVIIFDSQASPELLAPSMYKEFVVEPTKELIFFLHRRGAQHVPLIIGGNTTKILDLYIETGANNILCDAAADGTRFLTECSRRRIAFRRNIDSMNFLEASPEDVRAEAIRYLREAEGYPGLILGTGVVPYGTPVECLTAARKAAEEFAETQARID